MNKAFEVDCPTCAKIVEWTESSEFRPFCSDRCKKIDLGAWADESYTIPAETNDEWEIADQQANQNTNSHNSHNSR